MLDDTRLEALNRLREEFRQVIEIYNTAVRTKKVRTIRPAAIAAHREIFALSQTVRTLHPDQVDLLSDVEAAFMDVRWGRLAKVRPR